MKKSRLIHWMAILLPIVLMVISQEAIRTQSTTEPIIAKQKQIMYKTQPDGSKVLMHQRSGAFYRSSSGATMNTIEAHSTLIDERGNIYEINHNSKFAKLIETGAPPFHELVKRNGQVNVKGYETVNGFECAVRSILVNGEPGGKEYLYIPYGLLVKTEWTTDGGSHWMVRELYDIQIAEPDPASVQIPEGYAIVNDKPVEEHH